MTESSLLRLGRLAALGASLAALSGAGVALAAGNVQVSGSAYVDYWGVLNNEVAARAPVGFQPEAALRIGVDMTDTLTFSAKACFSCHGIEMDHVMFDWMPSSKFNVQFGRLSIPFGDYSNRIDPSGHRTATAPLIYDMGRMAFGERTAMNEGVLMLPYVDTGALVYGQVSPVTGLQVWYGVYVTAGLKGSNDVDWISMRAAPYGDNNKLPAIGGRVALSYGGAQGALLRDASLGGSAAVGRYDHAGTLGYQVYGADASVKIWELRLRGEYAYRRTDLAPGGSYAYQVVDPWFSKDGWYAELEHPICWKVSGVWRAEALSRSGVPLPGSPATMDLETTIRRYSAGLFIEPTQSIFAKLEYQYWSTKDFPSFGGIHVGLGGSL